MGILMPKKKKGSSSSKILIVIVLIAVVSVAIIGWHDGLIGVTAMGDINDGTVPEGISVTLKGEITNIIILTNTVTIGDTTGGMSFEWASASSLLLHTRVVVRGVVFSLHILTASSVDPVWVFA
jgi:Na+-transporting methylmalonyl-CoA/oxaloacetate decarboxylase beta subunit